MLPRDKSMMLLASLINYVHFTNYIDYYPFLSFLLCYVLLEFPHL